MYQTDTLPEAAAVQAKIIRGMSVAARLKKTFSLSQLIVDLARRGLRGSYPNLSEQEITDKFIEIHYGSDLAHAVRHYRNSR